MNAGLRATLIALSVTMASGCRTPLDRPATRVLRMGSDTFSRSFASTLRQYVPDIDIQITSTANSTTAAAVENRDIDLALLPASDAYLSYLDDIQRGVPADRQLRAIAALHTNPLLLAVRRASDVRRVADLKGRTFTRILIMPPGPFSPADVAAATQKEKARRALVGDRPITTRIVELVLDAFDVEHVPVPSLQVLPAAEALERLGSGSLDAVFGTAYFTGDVIHAAMSRGARLLPIDGPATERLRRKYAFVRPAVIPKNSYPGQTEPIHTVGIEMLLVCRASLDQHLVHAITTRYMASLRDLSTAIPALNLVDLELASATPIPLHDGAARYYRESELYR